MSQVMRSKSSVPTLTDWAIDELRLRIVLGQLAPGSHLRLEELADELGLSRVPLREAIRHLEAEGLIATMPRRGAVVTELSLGDIEDSYALLEAVAAMAIERTVTRVNPVSVATMRGLLGEMAALIHAPPSAELLQAHRAFHFALFDDVGDGVLLRHLRMLWTTCERYVMVALPEESRAKAALMEHEQLVALVEDGDVIGAREHLKSHLQTSLRAVRLALASEPA